MPPVSCSNNVPDCRRDRRRHLVLSVAEPADPKQRDEAHEAGDQKIVAGERNAEKTPLHFVAAHDLHRVEPLQLAGPGQNPHSTPA